MATRYKDPFAQLRARRTQDAQESRAYRDPDPIRRAASLDMMDGGSGVQKMEQLRQRQLAEIQQRAERRVAEEENDAQRAAVAAEREQLRLAKEADKEVLRQQKEAEKAQVAQQKTQVKEVKKERLDAVGNYDRGVDATKRAVGDVDTQFTTRERKLGLEASQAYDELAKARREESPDLEEKQRIADEKRVAARQAQEESLAWDENKRRMQTQLATEENAVTQAKADARAGEEVPYQTPEQIQKSYTPEERAATLRQQAVSELDLLDDDTLSKTFEEQKAGTQAAKADYESKRSVFEAPIKASEEKLKSVEAKNQQLLANPDGKTRMRIERDGVEESWHPDAWKEYQKAQKEYEDTVGKAAPAEEELNRSQRNAEAAQTRAQVAAELLNKRNEQKRQAELDDLRKSPLTAKYADTLQGIREGAAARIAEVDAKYPEGTPANEAAKAAIEKENEAELQKLNGEIKERRDTVGKSLWADLGAIADAGKGKTTQDKVQETLDTYKTKLPELQKKYGLTPEKSMELLDDYRKTNDWNDGGITPFSDSKVKTADQARTLSDGRVVVNPALWVSPEAYEAAVNASDAPKEGKEQALALLPELRKQASESLIATLSTQPDIKEWIDSLPGTTAEEKAIAIQENENSSPVWSKIINRFQGGGAGIARDAFGVAALITGNQWVTDQMRNWSDRAGAWESLAGTAKTGDVVDFATKIPAATLSVLPAMAGGIGASAVGQAAGLTGRALQTAGVAGSALAAGTQSAAGTYDSAYQTYLKEGLSPDEARAKSIAPAIYSGALTAALTYGGGAKGVEALFRDKAGRELVKQTIKARAKELGVDIGQEALEEGTDQIGQGFIESFSYNPDKTIEEALGESVEAALIGGVLGGAFGGVQQLSEARTDAQNQTIAREIQKNVPSVTATAIDAAVSAVDGDLADPITRRAVLNVAKTKLQEVFDTDGVGFASDEAKQAWENSMDEALQQVSSAQEIEDVGAFVTDLLAANPPDVVQGGNATPWSSLEPEQWAAGLAEIDAYNPPQSVSIGANGRGTVVNSAPQIARDKTAAKTILAVSQGELNNLTDGQLETVGIVRDQSGKLQNVKAMPDGQLPLVKLENGRPIIQQRAIDWIGQNMPAAREIIGMDEAQARTAFNKASQPKKENEQNKTTTVSQEQSVRQELPQSRGLPVVQEQSSALNTQETPTAPDPNERFRRPVAQPVASPTNSTVAVDPAAVRNEFNRLASEAPDVKTSGAIKLAGAYVNRYLNQYQNVFDGVQIEYGRDKNGAGIAYNNRTNELILDPVKIAETVSRSSNGEASVRARIREEVLHRVIRQSVGVERAGQLWGMLPEKLRRQSEAAYDKAALQQLTSNLGRNPTHDEIDSVTRKDADPSERGEEFLRQLLQNDLFNEVTEAVDNEPNLAAFLRQIMSDLINALSDLQRAVTNPRARQELQETKAAAIKLAKELGIISDKQPLITKSDVKGEKLSREWTAFSQESQSLGIPRSEMPQIPMESRGALTQFLKAKGLTHFQEEVLPGSLRPTQEEYSQSKVNKARDIAKEKGSSDRAILVSSDGYVIDGHHQWMAKLTDSSKAPMRVIRFNAPIEAALPLVIEFTNLKQPSKVSLNRELALKEPARVTIPKAETPKVEPEAPKNQPVFTQETQAPSTLTPEEEAAAQQTESEAAKIARDLEDLIEPSDVSASPAAVSASDQQDAAYLDAVERGDMKVAQKMVDAAAKKAGYDSPKVYHGTGEEFQSFDLNKSGSLNYQGSDAFFFITDEKTAENYAKIAENKPGKARIISAYLAIKNPKITSSYDKYSAIENYDDNLSANVFTIQSSGFDGVIAKYPKGAMYVAFYPSQIKSADPVTYDQAGNVIPLSQRFNEKSNDIRYSAPAVSTSAIDSDYFKALNDGDLSKAEALVEKAAKKAGYTVRAKHGTAEKFTNFDSKAGGKMTSAQSAKMAFFFTDDEKTAMSYAVYAAEDGPVKRAMEKADQAEARGDWDAYDKYLQEAESLDTYDSRRLLRQNATIMDAYIKGDFIDFDAQGKTPQELHDGDIDAGISAEIRKAKKLKKTGVVYRNLDDAVNLSNRPATHYAVFKPSQIKSADVITYDDNGNIIPLSERFNSESSDIRNSPAAAQPAESDSVIERVGNMFSRFTKSPEARQKLGVEMQRRALELAKDWQNATVKALTPVEEEALLALEGEQNLELTEMRAARDLDIGGARQDKLSRDAIQAKQELWRDRISNLKEKQARQLREFRSSIGNTRSRQELLSALRTLDAITSALPPEVRGRIGGHTRLSDVTSTKAKLKRLEERVAKIDREVERWLKGELTDKLESLIEKAKPKGKGGEKATGKIGVEAHEIFKKIEAAISLSSIETTGELAKQAAALEAIPVTDLEARAQAAEDVQILEMFGGFSEKSAADMDRAIKWAEGVFALGKNQWKAKELERLKYVKALQQTAIASTNKAGNDKDLQKIRKDMHEGKKAGILSALLSFVQTQELAFGRKNPLVDRWNKMARAATAKKTDAINAKSKEWESMLERVWPSTKNLQRKRELYALKTDQSVIAPKVENVVTETIPIDESTALDLVNGTLDPATVGLDELDVMDLREQVQNKRKKKFEVTKVKSEGERVDTPLTQMQAVHVTMLAAQPAYENAMNAAGYTPETIQAIEAQLTPEAKAIRSWLRDQYDEGYNELNALYEDMYGVTLPKNENYAPGTFHHDDANPQTDPYGNGLAPEGGMRAGFLKQRKNHQSRPDIKRDATDLFFNHYAQTQHWLGFAKLAREYRGVIGNENVSAALTSKVGDGTFENVRRWGEALERGGFDQGVSSAINKWLNGVMKNQVGIALAWKISTLMKQSAAAFATMQRIPSKEYAKGFARLATGQLSLKEVYNSPVIQRRLISGYSPEVRIAMDQLAKAAPSRFNEFIEKGMDLIGWVDAVFTTAGAAISYDYHNRQALAAGLNPSEAKAQATQQMEDDVARTAQPAEMIDRSLFEIRAQNIGKLLFMFSSAPRQMAANLSMSVLDKIKGEGTTDEIARALVVTSLIGGVMMQAISSAWRDIRNDDDDEIFDLEAWNAKDFMIASLTGFLGGVPLINSISDAWTGWQSSDGLFTKAGKAPLNLVDLLTWNVPNNQKKEPYEWAMRKAVDTLVGVSALLSAIPGSKWAGRATNATGSAITANFLKDAANILENITQTDWSNVELSEAPKKKK